MIDQAMAFYIPRRRLLKDPYHAKGFGLPNVWLHNGVTIEHHPVHGELVTIENLKGLHRAIGILLAAKSGPLTGGEFRFLRKQMAFTQEQLGEIMSVTDQTIANYEKEITAPPQASAHMKMLYLISVLRNYMPQAQIKKVLAAIIEGRRRDIVAPSRVAEGWRERELEAT